MRFCVGGGGMQVLTGSAISNTFVSCVLVWLNVLIKMSLEVVHYYSW